MLPVTQPSNFTVKENLLEIILVGELKDEFIKFMDEHTKGSAQDEPPIEVPLRRQR